MYEIIGYKNVRYTRKSDNKLIEGTEVYLAGDSTDDRVQGRECLTAYLPKATSAYSPTIGDIVKPCYNRWGRIDDLIPLTT